MFATFPKLRIGRSFSQSFILLHCYVRIPVALAAGCPVRCQRKSAVHAVGYSLEVVVCAPTATAVYFVALVT